MFSRPEDLAELLLADQPLHLEGGARWRSISTCSSRTSLARSEDSAGRSH